MNRLLVATDLSERSDRALERAVLIARDVGAHLTIVHVLRDDLPSALVDSRRAEAQQALEQRVAQVPGVRDISVSLHADAGRDWKQILARAEQDQASLIVLGRHRDRGIAGLFRGTTAERVIRQGDQPVLLVKERASQPYARIVVAVDFSVHSRRAVEFALALAPSARLHLVHVFDVPRWSVLPREPSPDAHAEEQKARFMAMIEEEMNALLARLGRPHPALDWRIRQGAVWETLTGEIAELKADLLVLGTHGRTGVSHALLGSVAEWFLENPPCDVATVKAW